MFIAYYLMTGNKFGCEGFLTIVALLHERNKSNLTVNMDGKLQEERYDHE